MAQQSHTHQQSMVKTLVKSPLASSTFMHIAILGIALVSFPKTRPMDISPPPAIDVEIIAQTRTTQKQGVQKPEPPAPALPALQRAQKPIEAPKQAPQSAPIPPQDLTTPTRVQTPLPVDAHPVQPKQSIAPPAAERTIEVASNTEQTQAPIATQPKIRPQNSARQETKSTQQLPEKTINPEPINQPDKIADIINKQKGAASPNAAAPIEQTAAITPTKPLGHEQGKGEELSVSDYSSLQDQIRSQILPCWSPPLSAKDSGATVALRIELNTDGTLKNTPKISKQTGDVSTALTSSALRAIQRCTPLKLPQDKYAQTNGWNAIEFIFDPKDIF